jgi:glycosyltransferase involved in cell wall biosynthesis
LKEIKQILFDAERMKYPHTGLFHFCLHLGSALLKNTDASKEQIKLFLPVKERTSFSNDAGLVTLKAWHKYFLPSVKKINVWHATHQDTQYFPFHKKIPVVLTIHDLNYFNDPTKSSAKRKSFMQELKKKAEASTHLAFISQYTLDDFRKYFSLDKPHTVIYNGCNIVAIANLEQPSNFINRPFLFTIGTITEKKNFHVLPVLLAGNDLLLVIAGITQNPSYKQKILQEAKKHNVHDRLIFTDAVDENEKQWYYQNCEAFVFPSLAEGFGLPVIEAMHFGKPVFLSKATSLPEIGGDAAFYFNSFDKEDMQQTLKLGLQNYQDQNLSEAIVNRSKLFTWQNAAIKYLEIYRNLY